MRTATEIQEELDLYLPARKQVLEGNQSWGEGTSQRVRADLGTLERTIKSLRQELDLATNGGASYSRPVIFGGRR